MNMGGESTVAAGLAASSGVATVVATIGEVTTQVLGVPLPVLLGAATGAFLARAYLPAIGADGQPLNFFRALGISIAWTLAGTCSAPLVHAVLPLLPGLGALKLPAGALAGVAGLVAAAPAWWPKVWPLIAARLPGGAK